MRPTEFAQKHDLDPHILEAACASLYEMELFDKRDGTYELAANGKLIIETLQGWLKVSYGYSEIFGSLEQMLRREKIYGKDFYRRSDFVAVGSGEMEDLMRSADAALYFAKDRGRNRFAFYETSFDSQLHQLGQLRLNGAEPVDQSEHSLTTKFDRFRDRRVSL